MKSYIDMKNRKDYTNLKDAAKYITSGKIVVFPTETVYGIGTNGLDEEAVGRLYEVKQRPRSNPVSLLVSNMKMVENIAKNITELEYKLMEKFFPGPFTIVLQKKSIVPDIVTAGQDTVGIRMSSDDIAQKIVEYSGVPIATPSANISGNLSGVTIKGIMNEFGDKVDLYVDGGKSTLGIASTVVQVKNEVPCILRQGIITKEQIEQVFKCNINISCTNRRISKKIATRF